MAEPSHPATPRLRPALRHNRPVVDKAPKHLLSSTCRIFFIRNLLSSWLVCSVGKSFTGWLVAQPSRCKAANDSSRTGTVHEPICRDSQKGTARSLTRRSLAFGAVGIVPMLSNSGS